MNNEIDRIAYGVIIRRSVISKRKTIRERIVCLGTLNARPHSASMQNEICAEKYANEFHVFVGVKLAPLTYPMCIDSNTVKYVAVI